MHSSMRIFLSVMVLLGGGCGVKSSKELKGAYCVKHPHGSETLVLGDHNTFTQVYMPLGTNASVTNLGKWEFWKDGDAILPRDAIEFDSGQSRQTIFGKNAASIRDDLDHHGSQTKRGYVEVLGA
jgi:hypothetical protein